MGKGGSEFFFEKIFWKFFFEEVHGEPSPPKRQKIGGGVNKGIRWEGYVGRGAIGA